MKKLAMALASVLTCSLPLAANATNGLFSEGLGSQEQRHGWGWRCAAAGTP